MQENLKIKTDPIQEIMFLRQQIQQEGNVDSELNIIDLILGRIEKQQITKEEGLKEVRNIIERRQNYH